MALMNVMLTTGWWVSEDAVARIMRCLRGLEDYGGQLTNEALKVLLKKALGQTIYIEAEYRALLMKFGILDHAGELSIDTAFVIQAAIKVEGDTVKIVDPIAPIQPVYPE